MQFTKKPVTVDAWQVIGDLGGCPKWLTDKLGRDVRLQSVPVALFITTLEGVMKADYGDWVIKGVKGEVYPCKHDIFLATYEPADDAARRYMNV